MCECTKLPHNRKKVEHYTCWLRPSIQGYYYSSCLRAMIVHIRLSRNPYMICLYAMSCSISVDCCSVQSQLTASCVCQLVNTLLIPLLRCHRFYWPLVLSAFRPSMGKCARENCCQHSRILQTAKNSKNILIQISITNAQLRCNQCT